MFLEIEKNTYADIEFVNSYIEEHYNYNHPLRVHFSVLTDDEKATYLLASLREIDKLPFIGRKRLVGQPLAFPRIRNGLNNYMSPTYMSRFVGSTDDLIIPEDLKQAQVENVLAILNKEISETSKKQLKTLQSLGAIKCTKPKNNVEEFKVCNCPITSETAYNLLRGWLGGISIC